MGGKSVINCCMAGRRRRRGIRKVVMVSTEGGGATNSSRGQTGDAALLSFFDNAIASSVLSPFGTAHAWAMGLISGSYGNFDNLLVDLHTLNPSHFVKKLSNFPPLPETKPDVHAWYKVRPEMSWVLLY